MDYFVISAIMVGSLVGVIWRGLRHGDAKTDRVKDWDSRERQYEREKMERLK